MPRLFISYSTTDKEFARRLAHDLQDFGISVWFDEWNISVGKCIVSEIAAAITAADFVAVVLSPHSAISRWVEEEWKS